MSSEQLLRMFIEVVAGFIGMPFFDFVKKKLGLENMTAMFFVAGLSALVGVAALFVTGEVGLTDFTIENMPEAFGLVFAAASFLYKKLNPEPQS